MTYLRQPRKDGKPKPPAPQEIRCRSAVNIADDATVVVRVSAPSDQEKELNRRVKS